MADIYDTDILTWSERQAELLRRVAASERINDQVDWQNVIEAIESVGRSELRAVESHLVQALLNDLKAAAWPSSREVPHWRAEARGHRAEALAWYTPSMARRIDVTKLYRRALRHMPETMDNLSPLPVPETCPMTLDELLGAA
jgi:Domain of unknown function DUF29